MGTDEPYVEEAFRLLPDVEARSFWFRGRNALILWALGRYFPRARSFLDAGCGTGFVLSAVSEALPDARVVGVEMYESGRAVARERAPRAELVGGDVTALPFRDQFDVAGAFDVLEHLDDPASAVRSLHRALVAGGGLLVTVPQHPWLWSGSDEYAHHRRRYERAAIVALLESEGFGIVRATSFVTLALPLMMLARRRVHDAGAYALQREVLPPAPLNAALRGSLAVEHALIRAGVDLPAGGSLLVVARKGAP